MFTVYLYTSHIYSFARLVYETPDPTSINPTRPSQMQDYVILTHIYGYKLSKLLDYETKKSC
jgi:hypothetical protein